MIKHYRLLLLFVFLVGLGISESYGQDTGKISLYMEKQPLQEVFKAIEKQTGYTFLFSDERLAETHKVSIKVNNASLQAVLDTIFKGQPVTYEIINQVVVVLQRQKLPPGDEGNPKALNFSGRIQTREGEPIVGASITSGSFGTASDKNGRFSFDGPQDSISIKVLVTHVQYDRQTVLLFKGKPVTVELKEKEIIAMQEAFSTSYPYQQKAKATGNISTVNAGNYSKHPIADVVSAMKGTVPGLFIASSSGVSGSFSSIQLRGQNWIGLTNGTSKNQFNSPLIIIDGVPLAGGNMPINLLSSFLGSSGATGGQVGGISPLNHIHIRDVETIEVLKDADATAIYGSRGANGVILITTKKAKGKQPIVEVDVNGGITSMPILYKMLSTKNYLAMRREALKNDNLIANENNSPDLTLWDSNRDINFQKYFFGKTAQSTNAHVSLSGGTEYMGCRLGASLVRENSVTQADMYNQQINLTGSWTLTSKNKRFATAFTGMYSSGNLLSVVTDFTQAGALSPNAPNMMDETGKLNWNFGITNQASYFLQPYKAESENMQANARIDYKLIDNLTFKGSVGLSSVNFNERTTIPKSSLNPQISTTGSAEFASNYYKSWIAEAILQYSHQLGEFRFKHLVGTTYQKQFNRRDRIKGSDYRSDQQLPLWSAAGSLSGSNSTTLYKYAGIFGAINTEFRERYIINLSGRRDGSSRYGPQNQFGNFYAVGGAWIISKESWFGRPLGLTEAKIRSSLGITGNDNIGDYMYQDDWTAVEVQRNYGNISGFKPSRHANPYFEWEKCRKFEVSAELAFWGLMPVTITYFNHRSTNQIINKILPVQTGFGSALSNLDAIVQNSGWEFSIQKYSSSESKWKWQLSVTGAIPRNRLKSFPGLSNSVYANTLVEGESLNVQQGLINTGLDSKTGLYQFADFDSNSVFDRRDYRINGHKDPIFFGGIYNAISYNIFQVDFLVEYQFRNASDPALNYSPGRFNSNGLNNVPVAFEDRWKKPGDNAKFQRASAAPGGPANVALNLYRNSDRALTNASFVRLRNVSISACLPTKKHSTGWQLNGKVYVAAENLFTLTKFKLADPSLLNTGLPTLRRIYAGIQIKL